MVGIRMTSLRRAKNGDLFARKRIPDDVRAQYGAEHGKRQEERFRRSSSTPQGLPLKGSEIGTPRFAPASNGSGRVHAARASGR
jgi:hypothetical protein